MNRPSRIAAGIAVAALDVITAVVGPGSDATVDPVTGPLTSSRLLGAEAEHEPPLYRLPACLLFEEAHAHAVRELRDARARIDARRRRI